MSKLVLMLFGVLTVGSIWMTYQGTGLQGIKTHSAIKPKSVRTYHSGSRGGSSGFSFGK